MKSYQEIQKKNRLTRKETLSEFIRRSSGWLGIGPGKKTNRYCRRVNLK